MVVLWTLLVILVFFFCLYRFLLWHQQRANRLKERERRAILEERAFQKYLDQQKIADMIEWERKFASSFADNPEYARRILDGVDDTFFRTDIDGSVRIKDPRTSGILYEWSSK